MRPRRVAVVSSTRADYCHLVWPLRAMFADPQLDPRLILFGAHLAPEFGDTGQAATDDGFPVAARVESHLASDTRVGMAKSLGLATLGLTDVLADMAPDLLLLIADRYEMLAAANVATVLGIPIAHIEGGEISRGAIDDAIRHAITRLSHLHLTPHVAAAHVVRALGEEAWRIHVVGAPSLDHLHHANLLSDLALRTRLDLPDGPLLVVAMHAVTMERDTVAEARELMDALRDVSACTVFCFPNADAGSVQIRNMAETFVAQNGDARIFVNLSPELYFSLLGSATAMIGNSSSGIMESASFKLPTVDVGTRQKGRLNAANVIRVEAVAENIVEALRTALSEGFRESLTALENPYGRGDAGARIAQLLREAPDREKLLDKAPPR